MLPAILCRKQYPSGFRIVGRRLCCATSHVYEWQIIGLSSINVNYARNSSAHYYAIVQIIRLGYNSSIADNSLSVDFWAHIKVRWRNVVRTRTDDSDLYWTSFSLRHCPWNFWNLIRILLSLRNYRYLCAKSIRCTILTWKKDKQAHFRFCNFARRILIRLTRYHYTQLYIGNTFFLFI